MSAAVIIKDAVCDRGVIPVFVTPSPPLGGECDRPLQQLVFDNLFSCLNSRCRARGVDGIDTMLCIWRVTRRGLVSSSLVFQTKTICSPGCNHNGSHIGSQNQRIPTKMAGGRLSRGTPAAPASTPQGPMPGLTETTIFGDDHD